jgi:hypothetical protein
MWTIFTITVLILLLALIVLRLEIGLYLMAFFLPVIGWLFYWHGLVIPIIDLIAVLTFLAFFIHLVFQFFFQVATPLKLKFPLWLPFLIFFGFN